MNHEHTSQDPLFSVRDQVVLVCGGSRGIGRALAEGFAERDARVVIASRDKGALEATAREIARGTHPVRSLVCDVAKPDDIERMIDAVLREQGGIDTLLNVAGVNKRMKVESYSLEELEWILDINLRGAFLVAQRCGRHMLERRAGVIVNIDSLNTYAPLRGVTPYAMSKAAVSMMTRGMASEWGPHGVRVNAIAPGFFPTDLSKKLWADPKMSEWGRTVTPLRRLGVVQDLIGAAIFLASPAAAFVTGQVLRIDGGVSAGTNWPIEL
jgi:NAD(P)-dependent dehydrogenase (short-subunit alcohol dehydrogenase family)